MPTTGPSFEELAVADSYAAWDAYATGVWDYWTSAIERRATPWQLWQDQVKWVRAVTERRRPEWATPHEIVWEAPVARLRDFSTEPEAKVLPTLVLPPQAGHDSCIVDYAPGQSQMRTIVEAGLTRAFTLDWVGATAETKHASIDDYLAVVQRAITDIGGPVNLVGDCQGGWLATLYAALHPEQVNTLTIAGAPIDFHCGEPGIHATLKALSPGGDLAFYRGLVAAGGGVLKGEHMLAGFVLLKPDNEVGKLTQLLAHVHEPEHVERFAEFEDWYKHTQDIPGDFYLWIVEHLFRDNELVLGELEIEGERVDLGRITCPINLLGGAIDHITPPLQVFALADAAATPEELVERRTAAGGHLGLFMGREALRDHWPPLLAKVREQSRPSGKRS